MDISFLANIDKLEHVIEYNMYLNHKHEGNEHPYAEKVTYITPLLIVCKSGFIQPKYHNS